MSKTVRVDVERLLMVESIKRAIDPRDSFIGTAEVTRKVFQTNLAPMAILSRRRGRILDVNDAFITAFELTRTEAIGRTMAELGLIDIHRFEEALSATRTTGILQNLELSYSGPGRGTKWMSWSAEVIRYDDQECFLSVFLDLTKRKQIEDALQKSMQRVEAMNRQLAREIERANLYAAKAAEASGAKSAFLAHTSHELRTPLSAIVGFTEMLLDDELTDTQRHLLKMIELSADHLLSLIDNLLDLSKIEAHRIELENVPFNLENLVYQSIEQVAARTVAPGVELLCDMTGAPTEVMGDPLRLRQVLVNLLSNAAKHTREGFILVHAKEIAASGDRVRVGFQVRDTGSGIPHDALQAIFEPFVQTGATEARRSGGTGLGLAITKHLVALMEGDISVHSELGVGSIFSFDIWLTRQMSNREPSWTAGCTALVDKKVLVIDDNPVAAEVAAALLAQSGAAVMKAESLAAAMSLLGRKAFDFVFVDLALEQRDAEAMAEQLRLMMGPQTPLIAMSSETAQLRRGRGTFNGYLVRPLRMRPLVSLVNHILGMSASNDKVTVPPSPALQPFCKATILVAEDHVVNQHMMIHMLEKMGHDVKVASDGRAAVDIALRGEIDLVFMDIQMPGMSGIEATEELRRQGVNIPIIALTAIAMKGDKERILQSGMNDYVAKPVKQHVLQDVIQRHLGMGSFSDLHRRVRSMIISNDEGVISMVESAMANAVPGIRMRVASSTVSGYVQIGSLKPSLLFVDTLTPNIDCAALVDFVQFEEQYASTTIVALVEPRPSQTLVRHLYQFPNVSVVSRALDPATMARKLERLLSAGMWLPSQELETEQALAEVAKSTATANTSTSLPSIDDLSTFIGVDREDYIVLLREYLESNGEHLKSIENAVLSGSTPDVHAHAHAIHGSSANLGLTEIALRARALEHHASAGDLKAVTNELAFLRKAFSDVVRLAETASSTLRPGQGP